MNQSCKQTYEKPSLQNRINSVSGVPIFNPCNIILDADHNLVSPVTMTTIDPGAELAKILHGMQYVAIMQSL